jgi:hypothetical protein
MSWLRWMTLCSFRVHNPDWGIKLYTARVSSKKHWLTSEDQDQFNYHGEDWRDRLHLLGVEAIDYQAPDLCAVSIADICRWDCLSQGEPFADMDIVFTRGFDADVTSVLHQDALTCDEGFCYLGLTGTSAGPVWQAILDEAKASPTGRYQSAGVDAIYRLVYGHADYPRLYRQDTINRLSERLRTPLTTIPKAWVHPEEVGRVFLEDRDYSNSSSVFGIHWFAGSPRGQVASATATPDDSGNSVARAAKAAWDIFCEEGK